MNTAIASERVRAVVFCNFPEALGRKLRNTLENDWGIDILYWDSISQTTEMKDPGTDIVIGFIELMSHGQSNKARQLADRWGARWVPLSRKIAGWSRYLPQPKQAAPVVSLVPSMEPFTAVTQDVPPVSESSPQTLDPALAEKQWEEIRDMFADEVEDLKAKVAELEAKNHVLTLQVGSAGKTEAELYELASEEEKRLKSVVTQLEGEIEKRDDEIASLKSTGLESLGQAIRTLVAAGLLEEREAADRLLNMVLGRRK